ncbi:MAG TPA: MBL fold metallo-hydrolase [Candidatus Thermoplasmatota archaeon]|nr:MBL fold metallo-hydrolase [Candidatus Thermoplasmatota archaeon]
MRLVTLGTAAAAVPRAGDAGSGHLVEHEGTRLLVDCGSGVLGALVKAAPLETLSAVYLSHLHHDHVADLYPLALWARFTKRRLQVLGPPGLRTLLYRWFSLFSSDPDPYVEALEVVEVEAWRTYAVGALALTACPVEHNVACFALRVQAGGRTLVYSGDTRAGGLVEEAAQGADLFLCEATYQDLPEGRTPEKSRDHHMTAREAGEVARRAGAKRLVLTHVKHDLDPQVSLRQAEETFGARVELAEPLAAHEV